MERPTGEKNFTIARRQLGDLYESLPPVSCTSCGKCCASPHITFVEAMHLFNWLFETKPAAELEALFNAETIAQAHAFNFKCRFENLQTRLCEVHPARGFICRVFGYPVLDRMGIEGMDNCRETDRPVIPNVRTSRMTGWLDRLAWMNRLYYEDFNRAPYHISGFNIESWLDIAVTDYGRQPFSLYHAEFARLPFNQLNLTFSDRTHLSTRLAKIDLFHQVRARKDRHRARMILDNLLTSEPMTGTFFRFEARRCLESLTAAAIAAAGSAAPRPSASGGPASPTPA
ncbi:YkgJ family cysteine cluster protein [bacterium]|nr:YkgJ family cysteine cluster protein [bacterium]